MLSSLLKDDNVVDELERLAFRTSYDLEDAYSAYVKYSKTREEADLEKAFRAALPVIGKVLTRYSHGSHAFPAKDLLSDAAMRVYTMLRECKLERDGDVRGFQWMLRRKVKDCRYYWEHLYKRQSRVFDLECWYAKPLIHRPLMDYRTAQLRLFLASLPKLIFLKFNEKCRFREEPESTVCKVVLLKILAGKPVFHYHLSSRYAIPADRSKFLIDYVKVQARSIVYEFRYDLCDGSVMNDWYETFQKYTGGLDAVGDLR